MISFRAPAWTVHAPRDWQARFMPYIIRHYSQENPSSVLVSVIMGGGKSVLIDEICACTILPAAHVIVVTTSSQRLTEDLCASISRRMAAPAGIWYGQKKRIGSVIVCCNDSAETLAKKLKDLGLRVFLWVADEVHRTETETILKAFPLLSPLNSIGFTATAFRSCPKETISLFQSLLTDDSGKPVRYGVADAVKDKVVVPWKIENWDGPDRELDESCLDMIRRKSEGPGLVNAASIPDAESFASYLAENDIPSAAIHSKMNLKNQNILLDRLKNNDLRAIVHVNILSEGANFPWLRWLCMRRQVSARVRFVQEIGRLLRSNPGKEYATFFDPHDLFRIFNLSYAEALGESKEEPEEKEIITDPETLARAIKLDPALSMASVESLIRSLMVACDVYGILQARKPIKKVQCLQPSTKEQHAAMKFSIRKTENLADTGWKAVLYEIGLRPEMIRFGFAADLQVALNSIYKAGKWPEIGLDKLISGMPEETKKENDFLIADKTGQFTVDWGKM